jgi:hypothetical protein
MEDCVVARARLILRIADLLDEPSPRVHLAGSVRAYFDAHRFKDGELVHRAFLAAALEMSDLDLVVVGTDVDYAMQVLTKLGVEIGRRRPTVIRKTDPDSPDAEFAALSKGLQNAMVCGTVHEFPDCVLLKTSQLKPPPGLACGYVATNIDVRFVKSYAPPDFTTMYRPRTNFDPNTVSVKADPHEICLRWFVKMLCMDEYLVKYDDRPDKLSYAQAAIEMTDFGDMDVTDYLAEFINNGVSMFYDNAFFRAELQTLLRSPKQDRKYHFIVGMVFDDALRKIAS